MSAKPLPDSLHLNPIQPSRCFSQPQGTAAWLRERFGDLAPIHLQGQDYALVLSPEAVRQVFSADYAPISEAGVHA
jgi:hypothetical protein